MKSKQMIVHNENTLLTSILKSIHHRMTPHAKKIIKANLILAGFNEISFKETNIIDFCNISWNKESRFFAQNLQFENKNKHITSVDYIIIQDNNLYICDLQFSARIEKKQVRKGLENALIIKEWINEENNPFYNIHIGSYYWGKQKKVKPISHLYSSKDFCSFFNLSIENIEKEIKKSAKELFEKSLSSIENNKIGFNILMEAQSKSLIKYDLSSSNNQKCLF